MGPFDIIRVDRHCFICSTFRILLEYLSVVQLRLVDSNLKKQFPNSIQKQSIRFYNMFYYYVGGLEPTIKSKYDTGNYTIVRQVNRNIRHTDNIL